MARGIYVTAGQINLNGGNGQTATSPGYHSNFQGGGGGGGGGSFVALAERDINGLSNYSILPTRINTLGGLGGLSYNYSTQFFRTISATPGGVGAIITQIIG
jgi:hypothetical protein